MRATPTILVNGYQLPESYKIEDLRYFIEFDVDLTHIAEYRVLYKNLSLINPFISTS